MRRWWPFWVSVKYHLGTVDAVHMGGLVVLVHSSIWWSHEVLQYGLAWWVMKWVSGNWYLKGGYAHIVLLPLRQIGLVSCCKSLSRSYYIIYNWSWHPAFSISDCILDCMHIGCGVWGLWLLWLWMIMIIDGCYLSTPTNIMPMCWTSSCCYCWMWILATYILRCWDVG